jgi:hypothetical protein
MITAPYIKWDLGTVDITADAAIAAVAGQHGRQRRADAVEFLRQLLKDGPVDANIAEARSAAAGVSERQLRNAASVLQVVKEKSSFTGGWVWRLPAAPAAETEIPF